MGLEVEGLSKVGETSSMLLLNGSLIQCYDWVTLCDRTWML